MKVNFINIKKKKLSKISAHYNGEVNKTYGSDMNLLTV